MRKLLVTLMILICAAWGAKGDDVYEIDLTTRTNDAPRGSVVIEEDCVIIARAGAYRICGETADGRIVVDAKKDAQVTLILDGVQISCSDYAPLYFKKADRVEVVLAAGTESLLSNGGSFASQDDNNVDAVIFSKCDVSISGEGSLTVLSPGGHGVTGKDDLVIAGGMLTVDASGHALEANDHLTIAGGTLYLTAGKDGIHVENDENADLGVFCMDGGSATIVSADDAVHAVASLTVNGGTLEVTRCVEGLEAARVYIRGGEVHINASDDALNATIGEDTDAHNGEAVICISGGTVRLSTQGDALDSNGDILISGGDVLIQGPGRTAFGYGALDYANAAVITGGRFVAITATGKAFSEASTQPSFNLNLSDWMKAGATVSILDGQGNEIISARAEMVFNCVIVSVPELTVGESCTVMLGNERVNVRQRDMVMKKKVQ